MNAKLIRYDYKRKKTLKGYQRRKWRCSRQKYLNTYLRFLYKYFQFKHLHLIRNNELYKEIDQQ